MKGWMGPSNSAGARPSAYAPIAIRRTQLLAIEIRKCSGPTAKNLPAGVPSAVVIVRGAAPAAHEGSKRDLVVGIVADIVECIRFSFRERERDSAES